MKCIHIFRTEFFHSNQFTTNHGHSTLCGEKIPKKCNLLKKISKEKKKKIKINIFFFKTDVPNRPDYMKITYGGKSETIFTI